MNLRLGEPTRASVAIERVDRAGWKKRLAKLSPAARASLKARGFELRPGAHILLDKPDGSPDRVLWAGGEEGDALAIGKLASALPAGRYRLDGSAAPAMDALAFLLGGYRFDRYRKKPAPAAVLEAPAGVDRAEVERIANAVALGRDLVNTPANDLGPAALERAARALAGAHGARVKSIVGPALLKQNFPLVHAVGRAAREAPRIVDISWNARGKGPSVALVGKGVCFDTGGLDIKPDAAMLLMKKDMGGAAAALAAGAMIMGARLPVRLRIVLPIVENAISGDAFRPGDVYSSRKGLTVEVGNTDAEGRLILADALALADEAAPDLLIDFATLTGAARVALGPDLPAFFTDDDALADEIAKAGARVADPVWRLPLWKPYAAGLAGKIADLNNVAGGGFAGSIVAALFLRRFVERAGAWAHFDIYGWNPSAKAGRPEGGEAQAARLVYDLVRDRAARTRN